MNDFKQNVNSSYVSISFWPNIIDNHYDNIVVIVTHAIACQAPFDLRYSHSFAILLIEGPGSCKETLREICKETVL